ncbi:hypothetical protein XH99_28550 [Bradyrhizobium nanningense]|uniref:Uncharacterized protein n=1 Tax=Bradyrhizobium nanningense TaxID=1325118 RepID=A0A4Q0RWQ5_9BRAD|nr:hypothetical protein XH99_28550 [Bradyrhizobium nanningense]
MFHCIGCGSFKTGARDKLFQWLTALKSQANSASDFYVGRETRESNSSLSGWRMLAIVPSEYVRDSSLDWDLFEVFMFTDPDGLVSVENYQRRTKGLLAPARPSRDWEYSRPDNETSRTRLHNIRDVLLKLTEEKYRAN